MIAVVEKDENGYIKMTEEELKEWLMEAYDEGRASAPTSYPVPIASKDWTLTNDNWWKTAPRYDFTYTADDDSVKPSVTTAGTYPDNPYNVTTVPLNVDGKSTIYCNGGIYSMDTETPVSNTTTTSASTFVYDTMTGKTPRDKKEFNYQDYINKIKKLRVENKKKNG